MVQLNFDANQVAPNAGMVPVPEGWYKVAISESEVKPTKDGAGAYLQLKCAIIDGPHANKPIFIRLNIQNTNQQAVDVAYGELSAICHATGVYQVADSSQLHGIPFQVKVTVRKDPQYGESNDVKAYKDAAGNEPGKAAQGGVASENFSGSPAPAQAGQPAAFGVAPQGQTGQTGQLAPTPQQGGGGGFGSNTTQPLQGGGQPTQPAQQPTQPQGDAGWTQNQPAQGQPAQGGAPWGNAAQ